MRRLIPLLVLPLVACSTTDPSTTETSETFVYAPMTSVPMGVGLSPENGEGDNAGDAEQSAKPTVAAAPQPADALRFACKQFTVDSEGKKTPAENGPAHHVDLREDAKGVEVVFGLEDFVPPNFTATLIQGDTDAIRRLTVADTQMQVNSLRAEDKDITLIGDFYAIAPESGEVSLTIPAGKTDLFRYDSSTAAGFLVGDTFSQCALGE